VAKKLPEVTKRSQVTDPNAIFRLQSQGGFGRIQAKELAPSTTPESSPQMKRKIERRAEKKAFSMPAKPKMETKESLSTQMSEENDILADISEASPRKSVPKPTVTLKSPPKPTKSGVTIRQNSVKVIVHKSNEKKSRPSSAPAPKKRVKIKAKSPAPQVEKKVDLRSYCKSLKLLGLEVPSNRREATVLSHR